MNCVALSCDQHLEHDLPNVLIVDHSSKLAGAELCLLDIVRGFGQNSRAFLFEDGPLHPALLTRGIAVTISRRKNNFRAIKKDRSLLRAVPSLFAMALVVAEIASEAHRHQLVYATSQKAFVLAALAASWTKRPLVWHLHDILSPAHFGKAQRILTVALANRFATYVIVPSKAAATAFQESGGKGALVHVVANGLDVTPDCTVLKLRAALGLPNGFLIGVFSRISHWKGQHIVIEALVQLPNVQCIIVGAPLFGETDYASLLFETANRLGVADRVRFLGHRGDVPMLMRAVDVMVHPSVAPEPFGRTLIEAMLCRTPVVAADNGAAAEILEDGRAGLLVPPGDVSALVQALCNLMTTPADFVPMLDYAEERAQTCYNASRMIVDVQNLLRQTLVRSRS